MNAAALLTWYRSHGRSRLPWRATRDPYYVLVSEFMLQQTQVERVVPLYEAFIAAFPDVAALAAASPGDVMRAWRGLGYNTRAARLHAIAVAVVERHDGRMPHEREVLVELPGIGPYTAAALRAFAFELDDVAADVNLRRVAHRATFGLEFPPQASPRELDAVLQRALPPGLAHDWNSALMDVGATICTARAPKCLLCPLRPDCAAAPVDAVQLAARARGATRRSPQEALPFEQTTRFLRGRIVDRLRDLAPGATLSLDELGAIAPDRCAEIPAIVAALARDGIVHSDPSGVRLR